MTDPRCPNVKEEEMDVRDVLSAVFEAGRRDRTAYHVTLGEMIDTLSEADPHLLVSYDDGRAPGRARSYRGYYDDLAFEDRDTCTVQSLLAECRSALGATFEGYKGGDYVMDAKTPLWRSEYGTTGEAIVAATVTGDAVILTTKRVDD